MIFQNIVPNAANDLDIHADPPGTWARVAVVGGWTSAAVLRKRWPHAAVVGPLRSLRGIDWLLRNLLANPQIRALVWDGPDLSDGKEVSKGIHGLFVLRRFDHVGEDIEPFGPARHLVDGDDSVDLLTKEEWDQGEMKHVIDADRLGGAVVLPPPPAPTVEDLPHGDPGQRVVGDTLADVWPRALEQAMRFGRRVQAGAVETREVLSLVNVIRDPVATVDAIRDVAPGTARHTVLGIDRDAAEAYYRQLVGLDPPGGNPNAQGTTLATLRLHMIAAFRSHDLFKGYPKNAAGLCIWLVEESKRLGMVVGTLTIHSYSAHVYEPDYADALAVIQANPAPVVDLDRRSNWRIFIRSGTTPIEAPCEALVREPGGAYARDWSVGAGMTCGLPATAAYGKLDGRRNDVNPFLRCEAHALDRPMYAGDTAMHPRQELPRKPLLVAEAIDPADPNRVIAELTSETGPGPLLLAITRSGLVTGVGHALWIGAEIERVWAAAQGGGSG